MNTYLIGIGITVGLVVAWVVVQWLWRRIFADMLTDEDVLAMRGSCSNCSCAGSCEKKEEHKKMAS